VECFRRGDKEEGFGRIYKEKRLIKKGQEVILEEEIRKKGLEKEISRKGL
jgi:hypothetical protein